MQIEVKCEWHPYKLHWQNRQNKNHAERILRHLNDLKWNQLHWYLIYRRPTTTITQEKLMKINSRQSIRLVYRFELKVNAYDLNGYWWCNSIITYLKDISVKRNEKARILYETYLNSLLPALIAYRQYDCDECISWILLYCQTFYVSFKEANIWNRSTVTTSRIRTYTRTNNNEKSSEHVTKMKGA